MIHILVTSHGGMAEGMMRSVKMLVEEQEHLGYVTPGEEMGSDESDEPYGEKITSISPDSQYLVLCDIRRRTPFSVVSRYPFKNEDVTVIHGINLPILVGTVVQCGNPDIKLRDLAEYLQQQSGSTIGSSEPQDRTQETKVRSPSVHNEPLHQVHGRPH